MSSSGSLRHFFTQIKQIWLVESFYLAHSLQTRCFFIQFRFKDYIYQSLYWLSKVCYLRNLITSSNKGISYFILIQLSSFAIWGKNACYCNDVLMIQWYKVNVTISLHFLDPQFFYMGTKMSGKSHDLRSTGKSRRTRFWNKLRKMET